MTQEEFIKTIDISIAKRESQIRSEQIRRGIKAKKDRQMKIITSGGPIAVERVSRTSRK
jgi:DNA invertase Pin-like site-specific DNA recombinase